MAKSFIVHYTVQAEGSTRIVADSKEEAMEQFNEMSLDNLLDMNYISPDSDVVCDWETDIEEGEG